MTSIIANENNNNLENKLKHGGNEMSKVKIPKFVAERIELNEHTLRGNHITYQLSLLSVDQFVSDWLFDPVNVIDLIIALNNGYEVEVEYLNWDQAYGLMKEGKIVQRYSSSEMKLDCYKITNNSLMFSEKQVNELWRSSESTLNDLFSSKFVLVEIEEQPQPYPQPVQGVQQSSFEF